MTKLSCGGRTCVRRRVLKLHPCLAACIAALQQVRTLNLKGIFVMTRQFSTLAIIAGLLAVPALSQASSVWHNTGSGDAVQFTPEHWNSTKTRAEVMADVRAASADGTLGILRVGGFSAPAKSSAKPLTRQQVIEDMRAESTQAREARQMQYLN